MALKVYSYYMKEKLSTNRYHNVLMNNATFYLIVNLDGEFKEWTIQISRKYHYENSLFDYVDFSLNKVLEYNVLADYIKNNEEALKDKWGLSDDEFLDLKDGLKLTLIREFSTCSFPRKVILEAKVLFKMFVRNFVRRLVG